MQEHILLEAAEEVAAAQVALAISPPEQVEEAEAQAAAQAARAVGEVTLVTMQAAPAEHLTLEGQEEYLED